MGIPGFEPSFLVGIDMVRQAHGARLAALVGRRLTGFALVRFAEDGDPYADCPVVLDFEGVQVEICHWKFDELSIGWDTISTSAAITGWEESGLTPEWSHRDERLEPFVGRKLRDVALLERRPEPAQPRPGRRDGHGGVRLRRHKPAHRQRHGREQHRDRCGPA